MRSAAASVFSLLLGISLPASPAWAQASGPRLEVGWISLDPALPPPARPDAPREEGWPEAGSRVTWLAHVLNRGAAAPAIPYVWRVDGEIVAAGAVDVPRGEILVPLDSRWSFERRTLTFEIQPPPALADPRREDDALSVASDALTLDIFIEQGVYDWMAVDGRPGFERWIQDEIVRWNAILERAVYPTAPAGALDRIRLDRVVVLPDGRGLRNEEITSDLFWFFRTEGGDARFLARDAPASTLRDSTIVLHELLHQRGLTDLYAYSVFHGLANDDSGSSLQDSRVGILENGRPVVGTPLMPALLSGPNGQIVYNSPAEGVMGTLYRATANLTEHCVNGLNLRAGRRTPLWLDQWGNLINGFASVVQRDNYVNLVPRRTEVLLLDEGGTPLPGAAVEAYPDHSPWTYMKTFKEAPTRTFATDGRGVFVLPGDLFEGLPPAQAPPKSQVLILGVKTARARGYVFVPHFDLNLVYFRQGPELGQLTVRVKLHPW